GEHGDHGDGQSVVHDDEGDAGDVLAAERPQSEVHGHHRGADQHPHGQQGEQQQRGGRRVPGGAAPTPRAGGRGGGGGHSPTCRRVRRRTMNTGTPTSAVITPTCTSAGGAITRPRVSA